jgi:hypothetical protein
MPSVKGKMSKHNSQEKYRGKQFDQIGFHTTINGIRYDNHFPILQLDTSDLDARIKEIEKIELPSTKLFVSGNDAQLSEGVDSKGKATRMGNWLIPQNGELGAWTTPAAESISYRPYLYMSNSFKLVMAKNKHIYLAEFSGKGLPVFATNTPDAEVGVAVKKARLVEYVKSFNFETVLNYIILCSKRVLEQYQLNSDHRYQRRKKDHDSKFDFAYESLPNNERLIISEHLTHWYEIIDLLREYRDQAAIYVETIENYIDPPIGRNDEDRFGTFILKVNPKLKNKTLYKIDQFESKRSGLLVDRVFETIMDLLSHGYIYDFSELFYRPSYEIKSYMAMQHSSILEREGIEIPRKKMGSYQTSRLFNVGWLREQLWQAQTLDSLLFD